MNKIYVTALMILILSGCTLPGGAGAGPSVWIDRPLDGTIVPLARLIFQAHAVDEDGITKIEFLVADSLIGGVSTGGARMEEASIEWMPPAPGVYTLNVRATDTQGNTNARTPASVQITVSGDTSSVTPAPAGLATETPTPAPADLATETPTPAANASCQPTVTANVDANVRAGPSKSYPSVGSLLSGQSAAVQGRSESAFGNWWYIQLPVASSGHGWVWGDTVTAVCIPNDLQVVSAPPGAITITPIVITITPVVITVPPVVDNIPPDISDLSANPALISVQTQCGTTPPTTVVRARVTDASGIARVIARVSGVGEFEMSAAGDGYYQASLGPFSEAGTFSIFAQAQDNTGNTATSAPIEVQVVACPG